MVYQDIGHGVVTETIVLQIGETLTFVSNEASIEKEIGIVHKLGTAYC